MSETVSEARNTKTGAGRTVLRWIGGIVVFLIGFIAYWLGDMLFSRVIGTGMSWVLVGVMTVFALVVWIVGERRLAGDDSDDD